MSAFRVKQTCRRELRMSANDPKRSNQVTALPFGPDAYCMLLSRRDFLPWLAVAGEFAMNRREMVAGNYMLLQVSRIIVVFAYMLALHCSCAASEVRIE